MYACLEITNAEFNCFPVFTILICPQSFVDFSNCMMQSNIYNQLQHKDVKMTCFALQHLHICDFPQSFH